MNSNSLHRVGSFHALPSISNITGFHQEKWVSERVHLVKVARKNSEAEKVLESPHSSLTLGGTSPRRGLFKISTSVQVADPLSLVAASPADTS